MPLYSYICGFQRPGLYRSAPRDHDAKAVLIEAEDEAAALAWGQEITREFLKLLYKSQAPWLKESPYYEAEKASGGDCQPHGFIEPPGEVWPGHQQTVPVGSFPDFTSWLKP